jgi:uncharacterized NAD-dependent epimerase/dehydratase family protein
MTKDGAAIVWCEGAFGTPNGKTAHGLVRHTDRYDVLAVVDQRHAGRDAAAVLGDPESGIPVCGSLEHALATVRRTGATATHFVIGIAPDGGRLAGADREAVKDALGRGLNVDCGLHDFLSEDPELVAIAARTGARIRDVRKPPPVKELHHFSSRIDEVGALRVAVLGTDSAVGKRTTAVRLVQELRRRGLSAEMIGTGQTGWMQGVRFGLVLDSLINDFVAGELEHAVLRAWDEARPDAVVVEGQGSLMNPAYPGGFEILAATRPHAVVLQHAPARREYDGFPGFPIHPLGVQIQAIELISGRPVVAITLNHEDLDADGAAAAARAITAETGLPCVDPLRGDLGPVLDAVLARKP